MGSVVQIVYAGNTYRKELAEYEAAKTVRKATNKANAAQATLADFSRSLGNQVRMENAGKDYNEQIGQISDKLNSRVTVNVNQSLAASQRLGAIQSQAAAAGVGGSSVQLLDQLTQLQRNTVQQEQATQTTQFASSATRANVRQLTAKQGDLDFTTAHANLDFTTDIAPAKPKGRVGALIAIAVATYFGGPQAGQAAADSYVAEWKARDGKWADSANLADRAAAGYTAAFQQLGQRGGKSWASSAFNYNDGTGPSASSGQSNSGVLFNFEADANGRGQSGNSGSWWSNSGSSNSSGGWGGW